MISELVGGDNSGLMGSIWTYPRMLLRLRLRLLPGLAISHPLPAEANLPSSPPPELTSSRRQMTEASAWRAARLKANYFLPPLSSGNEWEQVGVATGGRLEPDRDQTGTRPEPGYWDQTRTQ